MHFSIAMFELKIDETTTLTVQAYDDIADYCFECLKRGDYISVSGRISDTNEIEIEFCERLEPYEKLANISGNEILTE